MAAKIQQRNEVVNRQCVELQAKLSADGIGLAFSKCSVFCEQADIMGKS